MIQLQKNQLKELENLFKKETLERLKEINLTDNYGQTDTPSLGDIEQGNGEGQEGGSEPQEPDDK